MNKCSLVFVNSMLLSVAVSHGIDNLNSRSSSSSSLAIETALREGKDADCLIALLKAANCTIEKYPKAVLCHFRDSDMVKKVMVITASNCTLCYCEAPFSQRNSYDAPFSKRSSYHEVLYSALLKYKKIQEDKRQQNKCCCCIII